MTSYRDRAWCSAYTSDHCINHFCSRAINDAVMVQAKKWWGNDDPPFAMMDLSRHCEDIIKPTDKPVLHARKATT